MGGRGVTCRYCCDNNLPRPVELFPAPSIFLMLVHAFSVSYSFISQTCLEHLLYSITVLEMKTAKIAKPAYNPLCYFQPVESGPRDFQQNLIISIIRAIKIQDNVQRGHSWEEVTSASWCSRSVLLELGLIGRCKMNLLWKGIQGCSLKRTLHVQRRGEGKVFEGWKGRYWFTGPLNWGWRPALHSVVWAEAKTCAKATHESCATPRNLGFIFQTTENTHLLRVTGTSGF